ncbi:MAG: hypothetical protein HEP80_15415 [Dolichospermum sp. UKL201]|jgi:hypothetical protein|nr:MAG: hypothetical protein HEP80_15415 [Dolichospermum sp. UKL201]
MKAKNKQKSQYLYYIRLALPLILFLTGCDAIISTGEKMSFPFPELSQIASWSVMWLCPALGLLILISSNWPETTTGHGFDGQGNFVTVFVPTGKTIPGSPEAGIYMAILWLVAYPIGYFYYTRIVTLDLSLTGFPNIDWILLIIILPLFLLALICWFIAIISTSESIFCKSLIICWQVLIILASLNLLGWLLFLLVPPFIKFIIELLTNFFSWLFKK